MTALLQELGLQPVLAAGHSAGAAVAMRMTLDGSITPSAVVSLNGALLPFPGMANDFFGPAARLLASSSITAQGVLAVRRLAFRRLSGCFARPGPHRCRRACVCMRVWRETPVMCSGALALMANWDLRPLVRDLPRLAAA